MIFAFFGYNESYAGQDGLEELQEESRRLDHPYASQKYNGKSAPRMVMFSPIAHENLRNPDLPDGQENNKRLQLYSRAMARGREGNGVRFVDLFTPSVKLYAAARRR